MRNTFENQVVTLAVDVRIVAIHVDNHAISKMNALAGEADPCASRTQVDSRDTFLIHRRAIGIHHDGKSSGW